MPNSNRPIRDENTLADLATNSTQPISDSAMLTVADVARLVNCSVRSVYRLVDTGAMPTPVRIGGLRRWRRAQIEAWIADGCPKVKGGQR